eukprot:TRINITY_DN19785_c0_g1_i1.p1 TRINITY_DN19785_c0_g1~~TRINITY_DN19785_c0_g1_i1.p1  ORF type:complete len:236 (+),score=55.44 TRINITY_DN19785_c0_g1_i1:76-783(+)
MNRKKRKRSSHSSSSEADDSDSDYNISEDEFAFSPPAKKPEPKHSKSNCSQSLPKKKRLTLPKPPKDCQASVKANKRSEESNGIVRNTTDVFDSEDEGKYVESSNGLDLLAKASSHGDEGKECLDSDNEADREDKSISSQDKPIGKLGNNQASLAQTPTKIPALKTKLRIATLKASAGSMKSSTITAGANATRYDTSGAGMSRLLPPSVPRQRVIGLSRRVRPVPLHPYLARPQK